MTIKRACAEVNYQYFLLSLERREAITSACDEILSGGHADQFPLSIWQSGSGTQSNMNVNEVISSIASSYLDENYLIENRQEQNTSHGPVVNKEVRIHPNDHVNLSQSSNDVFPSAMHVVVAQQSQQTLLPAMEQLERELALKQAEFEETYTVGRTHVMDALPIRASSVFSAYLSQLAAAKIAIEESLSTVYQLALGGTAVGSGANAPTSFGHQVIALLAEHYQLPFIQHPNLYAAVSGEEDILRYHGALKQLAATLLKFANDFRLLGSGPRCGFNEWRLPANEAGSSIMPGKVNPTQCEALSMVCLQVFGNELTVSLAASSGQLQLNTYRPVIIHNVLESIELLSDSMNSFSENCIKGLSLNYQQISANMNSNLSTITLLAPQLGYDVAASIANLANQKNTSLAVAAESLGLYSQDQFESLLGKKISMYLSE